MISDEPTKWAIICITHKRVYLTREEYSRQLNRMDSAWECPECGLSALFDDDWFDEQEQMERDRYYGH